MIRIFLLLAVNCLFIGFYTFLPDPKLHGWILTSLAVVFTITDTSLGLALRGFDEIEADSSLRPRTFRKLHAALQARRAFLRPMFLANVALRIVNACSGLLLVNKPESPTAHWVIVAGYLCASFGIQGWSTLLLNLLDISAFKSDQHAEARADAAASDQRTKLAKT